ncbi:hypothetical protein PRIPAC_81392 [Pristionchus pacificus]|uniref:Uncharacterized protein n=1 Tax=Pristionchus pacificus TaxID=54126 RepID=A0A2A6CQ36_PRIPA|nr:hypothetical protein PRIPAC_81392 [Pristionchus pacificus]|eukprot:PDM80167.1 hypothetical protein PRIPAC_32746 [Pristionchus pacificus]
MMRSDLLLLLVIMLSAASAEFCLPPCTCPRFVFPNLFGACAVPCNCPLFPWARQHRASRQVNGDATYPPDIGDGGIIYPRGPYEPPKSLDRPTKMESALLLLFVILVVASDGFCELPCICLVLPWDPQYRGRRQVLGEVIEPPSIGDDGIIHDPDQPRDPNEPIP